jgi:hypothetical protein
MFQCSGDFSKAKNWLLVVRIDLSHFCLGYFRSKTKSLKIKRGTLVEITIYLPTPDKRQAVPIITNSSQFGNKIKYFRLKQGFI